MTAIDSHDSSRKQSDSRNLTWLQTAPPCIFSQNSTAVVVPMEKVISKAEETSVFVLSNRSLSHVPNEVYYAASSKLCDTRFLDISKNNLSELSETICKLPSLVGLNCEKNVIRSVSSAFSKLVHLQFLNLSCNQLTELPESLTVVPRLKILILRSNNISSVSPTIVRLTNLEKLDLSHNELTTLPDEICCLRTLRCLNLRQNSLRTIPEDMGLMHLDELNLSVNRLRSLPLSLVHMRVCLRRLVIQDNPLDAPPLHIALRGKNHMLNYLYRQQRNEKFKNGLGLFSQHPNTGASFTFSPLLAPALENASRDSGYQTSDCISSSSNTRVQSSDVTSSAASAHISSSRRPLSNNSRNNSDKLRSSGQSTPSRGSRSSSFCNGSSPEGDDKVNGGFSSSGSWGESSQPINIRSNTDSSVPQKYSSHPVTPTDLISNINSSLSPIGSPESNSSSDPVTPTAPSALQDEAMDEFMGSTTYYGVNRRVSSSPSSRHKCENRCSHESTDSTSSTLTDKSSDDSPRKRNTKTADNNKGALFSVGADDFDVSDFEEFNADNVSSQNTTVRQEMEPKNSGNSEEECYPSLRRRSNAMGESESGGTLCRKRSSLRNNAAELHNKFMANNMKSADHVSTNGGSADLSVQGQSILKSGESNNAGLGRKNNNSNSALTKTAPPSGAGCSKTTHFSSNLFSAKLTKLEGTMSSPHATTIPENLAAIITQHAKTDKSIGDVITSKCVTPTDVATNHVKRSTDVTNYNMNESVGSNLQNLGDGNDSVITDNFNTDTDNDKNCGAEGGRFAQLGNITVRRHAIHIQKDQKMVSDIRKAMESILSVNFGPDFQESISDGVHLCNFVNSLKLGSARVDPAKIHKGSLIRNKLQNANQFVDACLSAGLSQNEICTPYDIVEAKNLHIVCRTLQMLLEHQPLK